MRHYIITMYAWDANGNMTKDRNRGIAEITYDATGKPMRVTFEDGTYTDYTYDATGRKLRSAHPPIQGHSLLDPITINGGAVTQGAGNEINGGGLHDPGGPGGGIVGPIVPSYQGDTIEYCGNTVVVNGKVSRVAHDKGYITFDEVGDPLFHYYLRDHLGSIRVVFNEQDSTERVNHYYASGALMDVSTGSAEQPLKYNGKELVREWGIEAYDYGARWMLPVTGPMFMQIDPLCEKYYDTSPYSYCKGNFMNAIDPDGRDDYYTRDGRYVGSDYRSTDNMRIMVIPNFLLKWLKPNDYYSYSFSLGFIDLSAKAFSNIFTDVLQRNEFDTSKLYNSKVSIVKYGPSKSDNLPFDEIDNFNRGNLMSNIDWNEKPVAQTTHIDKDIVVTAYIYPIGDDDREMHASVSNIINLLGIHEFNSHGQLGYPESKHDIIMREQFYHWSWQKTTPHFKKYYANRLKRLNLK